MYFKAPDIIGEAESKLQNLVMNPNMCITKYLVKFNWLASITGWDNCALWHQFYRRLPGCIKDKVSQVGKPATLLEPWTLAQQIDGHYWEQKEETQQERGSQPSEKANKSQNQQSFSSSNHNQNKHQKKLFIPCDSGSSSQNFDKKMSDLNDKIGKDGKFTTTERACNFANNLCLFCGRVGHTYCQGMPTNFLLWYKSQGKSCESSSWNQVWQHTSWGCKNRKKPFDLCTHFMLRWS